jgi:tetratricopeptide (TPR) repeat protein
VGRARKALADLNEALKREPYLAEAHFERGRAHEALGKSGAAEQDFKRAALLEPDAHWTN